MQHEREKLIQAESVWKSTLCLSTINASVRELCQSHCARHNDSGAQFTTSERVSDVFDRGSGVAHVGMCRLIVDLGSSTDQPTVCQKQSLQLYTDACEAAVTFPRVVSYPDIAVRL